MVISRPFRWDFTGVLGAHCHKIEVQGHLQLLYYYWRYWRLHIIIIITYYWRCHVLICRGKQATVERSCFIRSLILGMSLALPKPFLSFHPVPVTSWVAVNIAPNLAVSGSRWSRETDWLRNPNHQKKLIMIPRYDTSNIISTQSLEQTYCQIIRLRWITITVWSFSGCWNVANKIGLKAGVGKNKNRKDKTERTLFK